MTLSRVAAWRAGDMRRLLTIWLFVLVPAFAIGTATPSLAAEGRWTELTPMPIAAGGLDSATVNGLTYAIGGSTSGFATFLQTTQVYAPKTNTWLELAPMPTARINLAVAAAGGLVYAIGGYVGPGAPTKAVEAYDPITNIWHVAASLPDRRASAAAVTVGGRIFVVGGVNGNPLGFATTTDVYDPS